MRGHISLGIVPLCGVSCLCALQFLFSIFGVCTFGFLSVSSSCPLGFGIFWYLLSLCHHNFHMSVPSYTGRSIVLFPVFTLIFTLIGFSMFFFRSILSDCSHLSPSLISQMCTYSPVPRVCAPQFWAHLHLVTCVGFRFWFWVSVF